MVMCDLLTAAIERALQPEYAKIPSVKDNLMILAPLYCCNPHVRIA